MRCILNVVFETLLVFLAVMIYVGTDLLIVGTTTTDDFSQPWNASLRIDWFMVFNQTIEPTRSWKIR